MQYVGQTHQKFSQRINKHKFDIKHFPDIVTTVSEHFNLPGHSIKDFSFMRIDRVTGNRKRLMKETLGCIGLEQCVLSVCIQK